MYLKAASRHAAMTATSVLADCLKDRLMTWLGSAAHTIKVCVVGAALDKGSAADTLRRLCAVSQLGCKP